MKSAFKFLGIAISFLFVAQEFFAQERFIWQQISPTALST